MKRYEGLFILNTVAREEGVKEAIDRITADINATGGKVETVQKMDKRAFVRVANRKHSSGFYVNIIFETDQKALSQLKHKFGMSEEIFRTLITIAPPPKPEATPVAAP